MRPLAARICIVAMVSEPIILWLCVSAFRVAGTTVRHAPAAKALRLILTKFNGNLLRCFPCNSAAPSKQITLQCEDEVVRNIDAVEEPRSKRRSVTGF